MARRISRRRFVQTAALAGAGFWLGTGLTAAQDARQQADPMQRLNMACVGVGGKGSSDTDHAGQVGNIVALCDIDANTLDGKAQKFTKAQKFADFREMLTKLEKEIDAVTVSTPDHTHAPACVMAMKMKKAVYCQKPLTHSVYEARLMRETAQKMGVATQMGNQGTAENGLRDAVEFIWAGGLGQVTDAHVWTNRPVWAQGAEAILAVPVVREAALAALHNKPIPPLKFPDVPKHVSWDLFVGPAPIRPYTPGIHPFSWRGWLDYGTGALGDMACHTANMAFMALKLGYPLSVEAKDVIGLNPETFPTQAQVTWQFPARGDMGPLAFHWYEGQYRGRKKLPADALLNKVLKPGEKPSDSGSILVGEKGILYSPNDYGAEYRLIMNPGFEVKKPAPSLARNGKGDLGMKQEWVEAIKGGPKPFSNFDYAAMLTEVILLGNIAMTRMGTKLMWDGPNLKFTNDAEATKLVRREYRQGWTL